MSSLQILSLTNYNNCQAKGYDSKEDDNIQSCRQINRNQKQKIKKMYISLRRTISQFKIKNKLVRSKEKSLKRYKQYKTENFNQLILFYRICQKFKAHQNKRAKLQVKPNMPKGLMFKAPFAAKQQMIETEKDAQLYMNPFLYISSDYDSLQNRIKKCSQELSQMQHNIFNAAIVQENKTFSLHPVLLYYKLTNQDQGKKISKNYHIKNDANDQQLKIFLEEYKRISKEINLKNILILKPGQNSNRGSGITVVKQLKQINNMININKITERENYLPLSCKNISIRQQLTDQD